MKKVTIILFPAILLGFISCKKHIEGAVSLPTLDSIVLLYPGLHEMEIETFSFSGQRLVTFTQMIVDSNVGGMVDSEVQINNFNFAGNELSPNSVSIVNSLYYPLGHSTADIYPLGYGFKYDNHGRLIEDVGMDNAHAGFSWTYSRDTVYEAPNGSSYVPYEEFVVNGGNLSSYGRGNIAADQVKNPLYDGQIAATYAPFFFHDPPEILNPPGYFSFPIDFVSQHLPFSAYDYYDGVQLAFSWETDANGKVTSGMMSGLSNGPAYILFTYLK